MENKNTISGLDNIIATGVIVSFLVTITSIFSILFTTTKEIFAEAAAYAGTVSSYGSSSTGYSYVCDCYETISARTSLTLLILALPIFIALMWYMHKKYDRAAEKWNSALQRVYLHGLLYISTLMALSVVVKLIYDILGGEFSWENGVNGAATLVIAAIMFFYRRYSILVSESIPENFVRTSQYFLGGLIGLTIAVVAAHLYFVGSPASQVRKLNDAARISDLSSLQSALQYHYQYEGELPDNINSIYDFYGATTDMKTGKEYGYTYSADDGQTYSLCATFEEPYTSKGTATTSDELNSSYWNHGVGEKCFKKKVDAYAPTDSDNESYDDYNGSYEN